jgi:mannose-6-phosphate isomerase-like protein (cupin superfamily)
VSEPILVPPGGGEIVGGSPERRVEILSDHEAVHSTWTRFAPGREGADLHVHHNHSDLFYVLEGDLTVRLEIDDSSVVVPAGTRGRVPPFVVHGFRNASDPDYRFLNFHAPGSGFADFLRALRDGRSLSYDQHPPPPDGGRSPADAVVGSDGFVTTYEALQATLLTDVEEIAIA